MKVKIKKGKCRGKELANVEFTALDMPKQGRKGWFIPVDAVSLGMPGVRSRVYISSLSDAEFEGLPDSVEGGQGLETPEQTEVESISTVIKVSKDSVLEGDFAKPDGTIETEAQAIERINSRFYILEKLTEGVCLGVLKGLIVRGAAGVGKSYGVERKMAEMNFVNALTGDKKYDVIKGTMTPIGLYQKLYKYADSGSVLVLDDCDAILFDDQALNILKAALDSRPNRYISWTAESRVLAREGVPSRFEFKGGVIFITNLNPKYVRSQKIQDHLKALRSRVHSLDLTLDTPRDLFLRIKSIMSNEEMYNPMQFDDEQRDVILDYLRKNAYHLRELSLRSAIKIKELQELDPENWKTIADCTVLKGTTF